MTIFSVASDRMAVSQKMHLPLKRKLLWHQIDRRSRSSFRSVNHRVNRRIIACQLRRRAIGLIAKIPRRLGFQKLFCPQLLNFRIQIFCTLHLRQQSLPHIRFGFERGAAIPLLRAQAAQNQYVCMGSLPPFAATRTSGGFGPVLLKNSVLLMHE
ncbi:hypothetical protein [Shimia abyssi]|uniref:hypothetical protein n=1 Tax=Shimia abyssi TaxID=1662395 RepID=UPI00105706AF|nr:hypothetical protein [Shimia abyssi]